MKCTINYGKIKSSDKCQKYIYDSNLRASDNVIRFLDHNCIKTPGSYSTNAFSQGSTTISTPERDELMEEDENDNADVQDEDVEMESDVDGIKNNNAESDSGESYDELEEFCRFQFIQFDRSDRDNWPSLTTFRKPFLNALIASLQHYYEDDDIDDFEALSVKSLVVKDGQLLFPRNYQENNDKLARRFQINTPNIGLQLQDLIQNIATKVTVTTFKDWIAMPPQIFYAKVLETAEYDDVIDMSDEIYDYIASALNVPVGSADAERGFPILFHSLYSRRSRLSIETIDNILKIRLYGPPITQFVCYKFVEDLTKAGQLQSNAQQAREIRRKKKYIIHSDDPVENFVKDVETQKRWERRFGIFIPNPFN